MVTVVPVVPVVTVLGVAAVMAGAAMMAGAAVVAAAVMPSALGENAGSRGAEQEGRTDNSGEQCTEGAGHESFLLIVRNWFVT